MKMFRFGSRGDWLTLLGVTLGVFVLAYLALSIPVLIFGMPLWTGTARRGGLGFSPDLLPFLLSHEVRWMVLRRVVPWLSVFGLLTWLGVRLWQGRQRLTTPASSLQGETIRR